MTDTALVQAASAGPIEAFSSGKAFEDAQRMAKALSQSTLVPEAYRGNLPNCLLALEISGRIGASVFQVMQSLDIIHGRPSWRAQFLIGTVNASGKFSPIRYRWQGDPGTDGFGCRAVAHDKQSGEECVGPLVTIGLAKAEGWATKSGSKWKTMPELMLMYRAGAFWTRVYCPEMSLGMGTTEEREDLRYTQRGASVADPSSPAKALEAELLLQGAAPVRAEVATVVDDDGDELGEVPHV
jgi:hypothetical protein